MGCIGMQPKCIRMGPYSPFPLPDGPPTIPPPLDCFMRAMLVGTHRLGLSRCTTCLAPNLDRRRMKQTIAIVRISFKFYLAQALAFCFVSQWHH